ncbi:hypothetical protein A9179_08210 [Pseudomonas alcaligenes]|uniref:Ferritin-like domain-containing protein n=1 Tax=Aquipseudomonas alcaligenes TaxID=43263 RepID=A0ABR7RY51_AQUAC|nr:hypothetical protein [Pseudomonas alcaligenes]MBC9250255.1 hypothetical protein [Pseudomonas alcaligenes]
MSVHQLLSFEAPPLQGWPRLQAWLVDRIKRAALRQLHASRGGELLLLRMYLIGEEATEKTLQHELMPTPPQWLERQVQQHLREEQGHSEAFAAAMRERGVEPQAPLLPDRLSQAKIRRWQQIAQAHGPQFQQGLLVSAYAIGLCAEQMAERVLARHCAVIAADHPLRPLLAGVLNDERKHVRLCQRTLNRIVRPEEQAQLQRLLAEARAVDRAWGVSGALAMYLAGCVLRLRGWLGERRA